MDLIALSQGEGIDNAAVFQFIIHAFKVDPCHLLIQGEQGENPLEPPAEPDPLMLQDHDQLACADQDAVSPMPLQISQRLDVGDSMVQAASQSPVDLEAAVAHPQPQFDRGHSIRIIFDMGQAGQGLGMFPLPAVQDREMLLPQGIKVSQDMIRHQVHLHQVTQSRVYCHQEILRTGLDLLPLVFSRADQDTCTLFQFFHPASLRFHAFSLYLLFHARSSPGLGFLRNGAPPEASGCIFSSCLRPLKSRQPALSYYNSRNARLQSVIIPAALSNSRRSGISSRADTKISTTNLKKGSSVPKVQKSL